MELEARRECNRIFSEETGLGTNSYRVPWETQ